MATRQERARKADFQTLTKHHGSVVDGLVKIMEYSEYLVTVLILWSKIADSKRAILHVSFKGIVVVTSCHQK